MKEDPKVAVVMVEPERERRKNIGFSGRVSSLGAKLGFEDSYAGPVSEHVDVVIDAENALESGVELRTTEDVNNHYGNSASRANRVFAQRADASSLTIEDFCDIRRTVRASYESMVTWMCREAVSKADIEKLNEAGSDDDDDKNSEHGDNGSRHADEKMKSDEHGKGVSTRVLDSDDSGVEEAGLEDQRRGEGRKNRLGKRIYWCKRYGYGPYPVGYRRAVTLSSHTEVPNIALSPMELQRILESGVLALKNAQSHTMRKIIVFSCLCIRHGCEDFYELDFNHFEILRRGEPYKSVKEPGEHLLYSHPSGRTKTFILNRQNPILCPLRIIDEEKGMRPAGASTPSSLFLCIKYGGRTRNLPQNQYVRQRMGRNKMKSFGPLMCQMAFLVHVRNGSFFFKALGITLLFMAGFSDDQVRKESKCRNLNLLQKYYRSDESAKEELLFHPFPAFSSPSLQLLSATEAMEAAPSLDPIAATRPQIPPLMKKPLPLLVRKDHKPVSALVSAKSKPSTDRPYRRIPPIPVHLMKVSKRGRKPKNAVKSKLYPVGPPPFGAFPRYPLLGFSPMPPSGWRPGHRFLSPGPFPAPFSMFLNTRAGSPAPPPLFFLPYVFPPFMLTPPTTEPQLKHSVEESMITDTVSDNDLGSRKEIENIEKDALGPCYGAGDVCGRNREDEMPF